MADFNRPDVHAPTGTSLSCRSWPQEAAMRMIMNNLDPAVAEKPHELIVYGGTGRAARNWDCFDGIVRSLKTLGDEETLLVQSGKPVGIFPTHKMAPRVLISNSMLVPAWANWEKFRQLEDLGLTMYGQMTAGSWIYIGSQGIVQGTYETLAEIARQKFGGTLEGRIVLTAGLGGMGGAQPLAITMNGGVGIIPEVDPTRIERRLETGYCQYLAGSLDEAITMALHAKASREPLSVAVLGNAADIFPELVKRGVIPDVVTDQTSAHDPLNGYVPQGLTLEQAAALRQADPDAYVKRSYASMAAHVQAILDMQKQGAIAFDYGNNLRQGGLIGGVKDAYDYPGFVPAYIRPMFCEGRGPFRWVALSGDPADIWTTDEVVCREFAHDETLVRWIKLAQKNVKFQGLPARVCWLGYGQRAHFGLIINDLVKKGKIKAPIVIGRDHLDCGSVASPNRETEGMKDGSDAIADWPILNALLNTSSGASWVSVHHGGGVGIGYSIHAGMVVVADGTDEAAYRLERVLNNDPGTGVMRHADAGYEKAIETARTHNIKLPMHRA